jgi:hypothetical protein
MTPAPVHAGSGLPLHVLFRAAHSCTSIYYGRAVVGEPQGSPVWFIPGLLTPLSCPLTPFASEYRAIHTRNLDIAHDQI